MTLVKDERRFSPTTRYLDYAISSTLFHWQTQSSAGEDCEVGRRYRSRDGKFWLFVRRTPSDAYRFLGPVHYLGHQGSKPMNITWRLEQAMPASLFQEYATLAAA